MDFPELVRTRRTVNNYERRDIPYETVKEALGLSLWAPNHKLTFPWVYTWVGPRARAALADLSVELKGKKGPLNEVKTKAVRDTMMNPAHLIALGIRRSDPHREHEDYATLACGVQIATLRLWEQKIGTKWSTGGAWMSERTYEILGLDPAAVRLEGGLLIGVPQTVPHAAERPALSEFLRETT
jgi:nitroreductase